MVRLNAAAEYLAANDELLGLDRFGSPRQPSCIVLTPRFRRSRHIVVLVLAPGRSQPVLVGKLPRLAADGDGLAAEAANLKAIGRVLAASDAGTVPTVVAFDDRNGHALLLETAVVGSPLGPRAIRRGRDAIVEKVAGWLERVAVATAREAPDSGWYERLVATPVRGLADDPTALADVRALAERTLDLGDALRDANLPLVFVHGDFRHPNLLCQADGRLGVLDWERADPAGLPTHDLFFFLAYAAGPGNQTAFFGRRPWAWQTAERYAERVGIDRGLLRPLLAVSCARALAADPAAAHLTYLWREAVAG